MKKGVAVIVIVIASLVACKKTINNPNVNVVPSIPAGYQMELIIDASIPFSYTDNFGKIITLNTTTDNFAIETFGTDTTYTTYKELNSIYPGSIMMSMKWINFSGSKYVTFFPEANYNIGYIYTGSIPVVIFAPKSMYMQIVNGDTLNNFGH